MKRYIYILAVLTGLMSCSDDFLDKRSLTQIAESNFWKTEADAQLGINGVYEVLQRRYLYSGQLNGKAGLPVYDNFTDNSYNQWEWEGPGRYVEGMLDPSELLFEYFWGDNYAGVARANQAIANIDRMTEEQIELSRKESLLGQAFFLRALFYFNLAVFYEDVPLITEPQTLQEAYVAKNSYAEVIAQVIADLEYAQSKLPVSQPGELYGYATKGSALGLLSRVYLYDGQYGKVVEKTGEMLSLGYGLYSDYGTLFTQASEKSNEIVFSVRFLYGADHNNGEVFSALYLSTPKIDVRPLPNAVDDFYCTDGLPVNQSPLYNPQDKKGNRDPRLSASVYFKGDVYHLDPERKYDGGGPTKFGLKKYLRNATSPEGFTVTQPGSQDFYVIRYADVLLMRAEALIEANTLNQEVYDLINVVRGRVGMPKVEDVEGTGLSQDQLRQIVRHERRVELAFEGLRFTDLKRWGIMEEAYQRMTNDPVTGLDPLYQGRKSETFPVPLSELDANKNLTQHSAWSN
ncbi:MAG: RagB/SusD family nutrient uptake outer membrane protein [Mangrovibacterium sp.]